MQITPNLGLKQPSQTDFYDVQDFNDNMQLIDDAIGDIADKVSGDLISKIYPVGSIYMSVNDVDPAVLFGGTWEKLPAGRCLIGAGKYSPTSTSGDTGTTYTLGRSGGQRAIKLTTTNMPSHTHSATAGLAGEHHHLVQICSALDSDQPLTVIRRGVPTSPYINTSGTQYCVGQSTSVGSGRKYYVPYTAYAQDHKHNITIQSTGSGSAVNIQDPYLVVNMWKRTA